MKLSVVIPAFDQLDKLLACLYSLRAHAEEKAEIEYLVQDDASAEYDGPSLIHSELASVERNERNLGFTASANRGAARSSADVIFFVNHDVFAVWGWSASWDAAILSAFDDPRVGVVGARLLFPHGEVQSAGGGFDVKGSRTTASCGLGSSMMSRSHVLARSAGLQELPLPRAGPCGRRSEASTLPTEGDTSKT